MIATGAQLDRAGCSLWGAPEKITGVIIAGGSLVPGLRLVSLVPAAVLVAAPNSPSKEGRIESPQAMSLGDGFTSPRNKQ